MIINIAASGRFHICDLARELEKQGHTVRFYSYVPTKRLQTFGLKKKCSYSLFLANAASISMYKIIKSLCLVNEIRMVCP